MLLSLLLSGFLTFVELNCENLFDTRHDSLKQDTEFLPEGVRHWTRTKYWRKLNSIGQEILSCSDALPDLVALCEVENDTVMHDLTRRSLLRTLGYEWLMTESDDPRGIDVALLYQPASFRPLCYECLEVPLVEDMRPTRDILYVRGLTLHFDTLHVFVVHAPSRKDGEKPTRPYRMQVARVLGKAIAGIGQGNIIVAGDFNDYTDSPALLFLEQCGLANVTKSLKESGRVGGTYRYQGEWHSLDHVLLSPSLTNLVDTAYINDAPFLLEEEPRYGGYRPRRTYNGYRYQHGGFSDHLPLVVRLRCEKRE
jgi:endonuclease/exonuclease/phosphatase family metal-dependent hydrolase